MSNKIIAVRKATERGKPNPASQNLEETSSATTEPIEATPAAPAESAAANSASGTATPTTIEAPRRLEHQRPRRPERPEVKPLIELSQVTSSSGEVFKTGDKIAVRAPWGGGAIAQIASLYQDSTGCDWASYIPSESRPDWSWDRGCIRAALLMKG